MVLQFTVIIYIYFNHLLIHVLELMTYFLNCLNISATTSQQQMKNQLMNQFDSDDDENAPSIFEHKGRSRKKHCDNDPNTFLSYSR